MKIWLVEWVGTGDDGAKADTVSILNPLLSVAAVRDLVERLYLDRMSSLRDRMEIALGERSNPYPAHIVVEDDETRIVCGDGPRLVARKVSDPRIEGAAGSEQKLVWT
jgi:hypothetical protein